MEIGTAQGSELPEVEAFYSAVGYAGGVKLTDTVFLARINGELVGVVRMCCESECLVLRGMYISNTRKRSGIGSALLSVASEWIGQRECWCIPFEHLPLFYGLAGFEVVDSSSAPAFLAERVAGYLAGGAKVILMKRPSGWSSGGLGKTSGA